MYKNCELSNFICQFHELHVTLNTKQRNRFPLFFLNITKKNNNLYYTMSECRKFVIKSLILILFFVLTIRISMSMGLNLIFLIIDYCKKNF